MNRIISFITTDVNEGSIKISAVTRANGIEAIRMKGIRLPFGFFERSDIPAIIGSVTASKMRPNAVIRPIIVSPRKTGP